QHVTLIGDAKTLRMVAENPKPTSCISTHPAEQGANKVDIPSNLTRQSFMIRNTAAACVRSRAVLAFLVGSFFLAQDNQSDAQSGPPILSLFGSTDMPENVNWNDS